MPVSGYTRAPDWRTGRCHRAGGAGTDPRAVRDRIYRKDASGSLGSAALAGWLRGLPRRIVGILRSPMARSRRRGSGVLRVLNILPFLPLAGRAPTYARLLWALATDPRVPPSRKALLGIAGVTSSCPSTSCRCRACHLARSTTSRSWSWPSTSFSEACQRTIRQREAGRPGHVAQRARAGSGTRASLRPGRCASSWWHPRGARCPAEIHHRYGLDRRLRMSWALITQYRE